MNKKLYTITEFANKSSVSTRTLRYYHNKEILIPSTFNNLGHRMYNDKDLIKLQYILSLKFLGFSLNEIKDNIDTNNENLKASLAHQKLLMIHKKSQIEKVIHAITEAENLIYNDDFNEGSIVKLINSVQKKINPIWVEKYLTNDERLYMRELAKKSYSKESLKILGARNWTEEDQIKFNNKNSKFRAELKRLVEKNEDPSSSESQNLAELLHDINYSYSKGNPKIQEGMKKSLENYNSSKDSRKPNKYSLSDKEREFTKEIMKIYHSKKDI